MPAWEVLKKIVVNHFFVVVNGPNTWEKDHDVFKHYEMPKEIARVRKEQLKESMKTVMAYIEKMMREWQYVADCISVP